MQVGTKVKFSIGGNPETVIIGTVLDEHDGWLKVREDYAASIWGESDLEKGTIWDISPTNRENVEVKN